MTKGGGSTKANGEGKGAKGKKGGGASATPSIRDCANCGAPEGSIPGSPTHSACSRCLMTYYCSTKCQKVHWKAGGHKQNCKTPGERTVVNAKTETGAAEALATALPRRAKQSARASTIFKPSPDYRCPICLDTAEGSEATLVEKLACSHEYHFDCLSTALKTMGKSFYKAGCGLCRKPYKFMPIGSPRFMPAMAVAINIINRSTDAFNMKRWGFHLKPSQDSAVQILEGYALQGHRMSTMLLGMLLLMGARFIEKNEEKAQSLLRVAAGDGCAYAADTLAKHLVKSEETFEEGICILRELAEFGRRQSQRELAMLLANVDCLIPDYVDYAEALHWFTRTALDHGHHIQVASSAFHATILLDGKHPGVPVDMALKRRMQDIAADLMYAPAMRQKADALQNGKDGRERDLLAAYELMKRVATAPENRNLTTVDRLKAMVRCGEIFNISRKEEELVLPPGMEDEAVNFVRRAVVENTGLPADSYHYQVGRMTLMELTAKGRSCSEEQMRKIMSIVKAEVLDIDQVGHSLRNQIVGARVELCGLTSKKHRKLKLNGCCGVVVEMDVDVIPATFRVKLDDGRGPFSILFESLKIIKSPSV